MVASLLCLAFLSFASGWLGPCWHQLHTKEWFKAPLWTREPEAYTNDYSTHLKQGGDVALEVRLPESCSV